MMTALLLYAYCVGLFSSRKIERATYDAGYLSESNVDYCESNRVDAYIAVRRKLIAEPVFGQIKQALGFRQFSLRGLTQVAAEWGIVCLCHNLRKLYRAVGAMRAVPR